MSSHTNNSASVSLCILTLLLLVLSKCVHSFAPLAQHGQVMKRASNTRHYFQKNLPAHHYGHASSLSQTYRNLDTSKGYSSLPYNDDAEAGNRKQDMKEVATKIARVKSSSAGVASNVCVAETEEDYLQALDQSREEGKLVVVRFFASWCKTCLAIAPSFNRLARRNPQVSFIEIPVTQANAEFVQDELHVSAIPQAHIHHPDIIGPVEELRISRKHWSGFESTFHNYLKGSCTVLDCDYSNPLEQTGVELFY